MCLKDPSRDSVVCIAALYGLKFWGLKASILQDFLHPFSLASKLTHILQNGKRFSLPEIKRPGRNIDAPSRTEVQHWQKYICTHFVSSISRYRVACIFALRTLINHLNNQIQLNYLRKPVPIPHVTLRFSIITTKWVTFWEIIIAYSDNKIK